MSSLDTAWWIFPWHGGGCGPGEHHGMVWWSTGESKDHHGMVWYGMVWQGGPGKCSHGREVDEIPQRGVCALPCGVQQCNSLQSIVPATKGHFLHFTIGSILTVHHCLDGMCATSPPSSIPYHHHPSLSRPPIYPPFTTSSNAPLPPPAATKLVRQLPVENWFKLRQNQNKSPTKQALNQKLIATSKVNNVDAPKLRCFFRNEC